MAAPHLSIVSPVYRAEKLIDLLVARLVEALAPLQKDFEIILVEDGSPDASWQAIEAQCQKDTRIKGIRLSRNFGQHYAITAGLDQAQGEWVVVMDCDLQDRPEEILKLYHKAQEGYEVVWARRHQRQDVFFKRFSSWLFYRVLSYLTGVGHDPAIANFGIYHRSVIEAIGQMRESIRYFPTMVRWVGFQQTSLDVQHAERQEGKSAYKFRRLLHLALDIILAYSDKPIRLTIKTGFFIALLAFLFAIFVIIRYFLGEISVSGYASLIVSIWFFSGLIIMTLGVVGLYVGKSFEIAKQRPLYVVGKKINCSVKQ